MAFGSDWPISAFDPMPIIAAACLRKPPGTSKPPVLAEEAVTVAQALAGFTASAAYAAGVEHEEGDVAPGYRADLTILDRDLLATPPEEIHEARVSATVVDGEICYST